MMDTIKTLENKFNLAKEALNEARREYDARAEDLQKATIAEGMLRFAKLGIHAGTKVRVHGPRKKNYGYAIFMGLKPYRFHPTRVELDLRKIRKDGSPSVLEFSEYHAQHIERAD